VIENSRTDKHASQWIASLENHVPAKLWCRPIDRITAPELLAGLQAIKPHPRSRNPDGPPAETIRRIRQRLDAVFEDAIFHGRASANPAAAIRRKLTEARPDAGKEPLRALDYRAAPALVAALRAVPGVVARALEFGILTASRPTEATGAEWAEIDLAARLWVVSKARMKGAEEHAVYLSDAACELLRAQIGANRRWVFPSPVEGKAKSVSGAALLDLLERLGYRDQTTVHGLCRATFSTWANDTGAAKPDVIEAALAHNEADKVRRAYNRAEFGAERRRLLAAWADYLARPAALALVEKGGHAAA
jgi:integrase